MRDSKIGTTGQQLGVDIAWLLAYEKVGQRKGEAGYFLASTLRC